MKKYIAITALLFFHMAGNAQCTTTAATPGSIFFNGTSVGTVNWTQPQNAQTSDGVYATVSQTVGILATVNTHYLAATGFGFNIPGGATICGVTVTVQRKRQDLLLGAITDNSVKLINTGTVGGMEHANATDWSTTETTVTYGDATDLWGLPLTPTTVSAANFGVAVSAKLTGGPLIALLLQAGIDYITVAVSYSTATLPIALESFSAVRQNNTDVLSWTGSSDDEGDQFIVQRSGDSRTWQNLATIPAREASTQYGYTDNTPLNGNNFYRLYLQNKDAQGTYSAIQEISQEAIGISCYPNPFVDMINISSPNPIHTVMLKDLQGRAIASRTLNAASNTLQLPAGGLSPGIYILQVDGVLFKLLKQ